MGSKLVFCAMFVLFMVLVALVTVLALVWTMPDLPKTVRMRNSICLPSEQGFLRCGKTTDLMHDYLQMAFENEYERVKQADIEGQQKYLNENRVGLMAIHNKAFWEMMPAGKLTGKRQPEPRITDIGAEMTPIRLWRHGRELYDTTGFARYGIRYRNGRLVVPVSGTYFIYSFVDFFEQCVPETGNPNVKDASTPIRHGIYKFNILDEDETEIISNLQPHTISSNNYFNSYSSYVDSLAELKAGDEISVKVSNITYLRYTGNNYFGLNLI